MRWEDDDHYLGQAVFPQRSTRVVSPLGALVACLRPDVGEPLLTQVAWGERPCPPAEPRVGVREGMPGGRMAQLGLGELLSCLALGAAAA